MASGSSGFKKINADRKLTGSTGASRRQPIRDIGRNSQLAREVGF